MTTAQLNFGNDRLFYLMLLVAVVPIWVVDYVPGVDLAGHVAQAAAVVELLRDNPLFTGQFEFNWQTPYLTATLVLAGLMLFLPAFLAVKLLLTATIVAVPILGGLLFRAAGGDEHWRWLLIPSTYGFAFYWGFLPFFAVLPLGMLLLLMTIRYETAPSLRSALGIAALSLLLLASHILVLCSFSLLALAWIAGRNVAQLRRLVLLSLPYAAPLPLIVLWLIAIRSSGSYMSTEALQYGSLGTRATEILVQTAGLDRMFMPLAIVVTLFVVALPLVSRANLTNRLERWLVALAGFAIYLLLPSYWMGTAFVFERFGVLLPFCWLFLFDRQPSTSMRWHWAGILVVFVWAGMNVLRFSAFNVETRGLAAIIDEMAAGRRAATMITAYRSRHFHYPVFLHMPSWYQAEKLGIVDYNFGSFHGTVARFREARRPDWVSGLAWNPVAFDWRAHDGDIYDYFVVRANGDPLELVFRSDAHRVRLRSQSGDWWLYERSGSASQPEK